MPEERKIKTFANCSLYNLSSENGYNIEKHLQEFIVTAQRIDKKSAAFKPIMDQLKTRMNNAVVYKILLQKNLILAIAEKELPSSFKVIYASDLKVDNNKRLFIDLTGLVSLQNGYYVCREIDKLAAYLLAAVVTVIYNVYPDRIVSNGSLQKVSTDSFIRLFQGVLDYFRLPGYTNNKEKINYIAGVYFAYNVMRLNIESAKTTSTAACKLNKNITNGYDFYYSYEDDFKDIQSFITSITKTFKIKGLTTGGFLSKWIYFYGKGTQYSTAYWVPFP